MRFRRALLFTTSSESDSVLEALESINDNFVPGPAPEFRATTIDPGVAAVQVDGELDLATVDQLRTSVDRALTYGSMPLLIDFTDCGFIDSSVISLLVQLRLRLGNSARPRFAVVARGQPLDVLRLTGVDQEMPVLSSVPDALRALGVAAPTEA